jgi:hypothetical protein
MLVSLSEELPGFHPGCVQLSALDVQGESWVGKRTMKHRTIEPGVSILCVQAWIDKSGG